MCEMRDSLSIDIVPMDDKACGYYRLIYPAQAMYNLCKVNISPVRSYKSFGQEWIYTARICNREIFEQLIGFKKKTGIKFAIDYDDNLWEEMPSYNRVDIDWKKNQNDMSSHLGELADLVTCSTDALRASLLKFDNVDNVKIIKNSLDYNRWRFDYMKPNDRLGFFYAGSSTHWSDDDYGDFSEGLVKYLRNREVNVLGTAPSFLPKAVNVCKWADINYYPTIFARYALQSKFVLAPLRDNLFNRCKSDLKYLECAAIGRVCLCSNVGEYQKVAHPMQIIPEEADVNQIEYIVNRAERHYREIIEHQYRVMNERWLDCHKYIEAFSPSEC